MTQELLPLSAFDPNNEEHCYAAAIQCFDTERFENAKANLVHLLGRNPDHADAHFLLAQILLADGEWEAGLREAEWDTESWQQGCPLPKVPTAEWNGMLLPRGTVLVIADRGFGDVFQFAHYLPVVARMCHTLIVACDPDLVPLLSRMGCASKFISEWYTSETTTTLPRHDMHIRLTHVPMVLAGKSQI